MEDYVGAGEQVWIRQDGIRRLKREGDILADEQKVQYDQLLHETRLDREMCQAAFDNGFIKQWSELTLVQKEIAQEIRNQAEKLGIPWRGLAIAELMEVLCETAEGKRDDLIKFLQYLEKDLLGQASELVGDAVNKERGLHIIRDEAIDKIHLYRKELLEMIETRSQELVDLVIETSKAKGRALRTCIETTEDQVIGRAEKVMKRANEIQLQDDLTMLGLLHDERGEIDRIVHDIDDTFADMQSLLKEDFASDGETPIDFHADVFLKQQVQRFGSVTAHHDENVMKFPKQVGGWCEVKSEPKDGISFSQDGKTVSLSKELRTVVYGKQNFSRGTIVFKLKIHSDKDDHWACVGIANEKKKIQDSMIIQSKEQVVVMKLNCDANIIEYYINHQRMKVTTITNSNDNDHYYPFGTLFHKGQSITLVG